MISFATDTRAFEALLAISAQPKIKQLFLVSSNTAEMNRESQIRKYNQQFIRNMCVAMNITFTNIPAEESVERHIGESSHALVDFRFLTKYLTKTYNSTFTNTSKCKIGCVTSMADIYLANASLIASLINPKKLDAVFRWKRGLKHLNFDYWVFPELSHTPPLLAGRPVSSVSISKISQVAHQIEDHRMLPNWFKAFRSNFGDQPFAVISPSFYATRKELQNIKWKVKTVLGQQAPFLIKAHPRGTLSEQTLAHFESSYGTKSINSQIGIPLMELVSLPLELVLILFPKSIYFGSPTGSIHVVTHDRFYFTATGERKVDSNLNFQYSEFMKCHKAVSVI